MIPLGPFRLLCSFGPAMVGIVNAKRAPNPCARPIFGSTGGPVAVMSAAPPYQRPAYAHIVDQRYSACLLALVLVDAAGVLGHDHAAAKARSG